MASKPDVLVRDRETGHEYLISEARYKRTPKLWDRVSTKPKTTVSQEAAKKRAARKAPAKKTTPARPVAGTTEKE